MTELIEKVPKKLQYIIIALEILLIITGILLLSLDLSTSSHEIPNSLAIDYTNCINRNKNDKQTCIQTLSETNTSCSCIVEFNLNKSIDGDIILYHELDYNLLNISKESRDEHQLNGILSDKLNSNCAPYDYANTTEGLKPIAPCGEMADAMFNDTYVLSSISSPEYIPTTTLAIISPEDKEYHNPKLSDGMTLEQAFQNFSKPINWRKDVWQLNGNNTLNSGFEYEPFIAWMKKDWIQKPVWRLDKSKPGYEKGLAPGSYGFIIFYDYPLARYNGTRKVILGNARTLIIIPNSTATAFGAILLVLGILLLLATAYLFYLKTRKGGKNNQPEPESSPINRRL